MIEIVPSSMESPIYSKVTGKIVGYKIYSNGGWIPSTKDKVRISTDFVGYRWL